MNALLFDTLRLARMLREKGHFTAEQAEDLAEALGEAQHGDLATKADLAPLATKAELASFKADLEAKIDKVEAKIENVETKVGYLATKAELSDVRADILKWIVGAIGFQTVVMVGALVTLVRIFAK